MRGGVKALGAQQDNHWEQNANTIREAPIEIRVTKQQEIYFV